MIVFGKLLLMIPFNFQNYKQTNCLKKERAQNCSGWVYFAKRQGYVKIGQTGNNPEERITTLDSNHTVSSILLHVIQTNDRKKLERRLHNHFTNVRVRGEWFKLTEEDIEVVKEIDEINYHLAEENEDGLREDKIKRHLTKGNENRLGEDAGNWLLRELRLHNNQGTGRQIRDWFNDQKSQLGFKWPTVTTARTGLKNRGIIEKHSNGLYGAKQDSIWEILS